MTALYPFTASTVSVLKSCLKSSSEQSSVLNLNESSVTLHSFRTIPLKFDGCPMLVPGSKIPFFKGGVFPLFELQVPNYELCL